MSNQPFDGARHDATRNLLRIVGPLVVATGLAFIIVGMVSFFSSFNSVSQSVRQPWPPLGPPPAEPEGPQYFWCVFVGMPIFIVGLLLCKFAFLGAVARYAAQEIAPVGRDTFNYLASEARPGIRGMASAVTEGIRQGMGQAAGAQVICSRCHAANDPDARFCKNCGAELNAMHR
jgi:hypothetical protein